MCARSLLPRLEHNNVPLTRASRIIAARQSTYRAALPFMLRKKARFCGYFRNRRRVDLPQGGLKDAATP
jgi:hypothetical protein